MADADLKSLRYFLAGAARPGGAVYVHADHATDRRRLALGVAALIDRPVEVFEFDGDYVTPDQGEALLGPLVRGETICIVFRSAHPLSGRFLRIWADANRPSSDRYFGGISRHMTLSLDRSNTTRGTLVVIQVGGDRQGIPWRYFLKEPEISELEASAQRTDFAYRTLGVQARQGRSRITFKDLCLLHLRDSVTHSLPANLQVVDRTDPVTWTDLREFVRQGSTVARDLDRLHREAWLDQERLDFYSDAIDFLEEQPGPGLRPDIYRAVWSYEFLEEAGHYFRGQRNSVWRLDSTLYRSKDDGSDLDLGTIVDRIGCASLFVAELRKRQVELFGHEPDDDAVLAVAQHYGFATHLLDFTRSLQVAAFFATSGAGTRRGDAPSMGVIYHVKPDERQTSQLLDPVRRVAYEGFDMLREAGLQFGDWRVIEPHLADADNRIARQRGAFLQGANVRHLSGVLGGRILFEQQPGEVFENPAAGVTRAFLLPADSALHELAEEVRRRFKAGERAPIAPALARVSVPAASLVGVREAALDVQIDEAADFFALLRRVAALDDCAPLVSGMVGAIQEYFRDTRMMADLGTLSATEKEQKERFPIDRAVSRLCEHSGASPAELGKVLAELIPNKDDDWSWKAPDVPGERQLIDWLVLACGMYLIGWEHLTCVNGAKARAYTTKARELLHFVLQTQGTGTP